MGHPPRFNWNPYNTASRGLEARAAIQSEILAAACEDHIASFHRAMDDDFNTAGAIAALFDFAGTVNRFIEQEKSERAWAEPGQAKARDSLAAEKDALTATARLIATGRLIGLFLDPPEQKSAGGDGLGEKAMNILIRVRQHVRKKKDFETADMIRDLLAEAGITLEDGPDGTIWRQP